MRLTACERLASEECHVSVRDRDVMMISTFMLLGRRTSDISSKTYPTYVEIYLQDLRRQEEEGGGGSNQANVGYMSLPSSSARPMVYIKFLRICHLLECIDGIQIAIRVQPVQQSDGFAPFRDIVGVQVP